MVGTKNSGDDNEGMIQGVDPVFLVRLPSFQ